MADRKRQSALAKRNERRLEVNADRYKREISICAQPLLVRIAKDLEARPRLTDRHHF